MNMIAADLYLRLYKLTETTRKCGHSQSAGEYGFERGTLHWLIRDDGVLGLTVIGHRPDRGWILVDAGWMAMSRDRGTAAQAVDQGYGLVCDAGGRPYPDLIMGDANQEHGILSLREGAAAGLPDLPVGSQVRLLPNHACATAAQFDRYHVLDDDIGGVAKTWPRFSGW